MGQGGSPITGICSCLLLIQARLLSVRTACGYGMEVILEHTACGYGMEVILEHTACGYGMEVILEHILHVAMGWK